MLIKFEEISRDIDTLPEEAQILLLDFIQLLKKHYPQPESGKAKERLETILLEGLNSGNATEMTVQDWQNIRQTIRERMNKHQGTI